MCIIHTQGRERERERERNHACVICTGGGGKEGRQKGRKAARGKSGRKIGQHKEDSVEVVGLLEGGRLRGGLHFSVEVESDVGQLPLDVTDDFALGSGGERVTALGEDLHQVVGQVAAGEVQAHDGVRKSVTLADRDGVRHAIPRAEDATGGAAGGVQGERAAYTGNCRTRQRQTRKRWKRGGKCTGRDLSWARGGGAGCCALPGTWIITGQAKESVRKQAVRKQAGKRQKKGRALLHGLGGVHLRQRRPHRSNIRMVV